ncbi:MAG: enoyl-CoA hydratase/isomerase family protein [Rhizobacter sp.]|nr:enoyl-CoA hydratase/isomerase family protein [Rhizobacter sp.]
MASEKLIARKADGVGWMIFNNPDKLNAISLEMWEAALETMADFSADASVRVMVLTGAGGKAFASGADISKFKDERQAAEAVAHYQATTQQAYTKLQSMAIPTIAMIRGYCIGGGTAAAVCCDIRICTENAKFGVPAAKLGLGYGLNRAQPLVDLIGPAHAKEMFFTGRQFDAREAERMGLVNRVVADDALETTVEEMAKMIAANAPLTVRCAKLVVGEAVKNAADRDVDACEHAVARCFASNDYREGQAAFMEKRKPRFTGT